MSNVDYKKKLNEVAEKIKNSNLTDQQKTDLLLSVLDTKINLMITGGTGCGKSSTINALFNQEKAKVGTSPSPETTTTVAAAALAAFLAFDSGLSVVGVASSTIVAVLSSPVSTIACWLSVLCSGVSTAAC